jgi:hypothetical protein
MIKTRIVLIFFGLNKFGVNKTLKLSYQNGERSRCDEQDGGDVEELAGKREKVEQEDGADDAASCYHDGPENQ